MKMIKPLFVFSCLLMFSCNIDNSFVMPDEEMQLQNDFLAQKVKDKIIKVFRSSDLVTIDGLENEWADVPKHKMRKEVNVGINIESKFDLSGYFKILWDDNNLYFFASIQDEEINVSGAQLFEKDGLEIYIDGDNSKNVAPGLPTTFPPPAYDSNDDFIRFIPYETNPLSAWGIIDPSNFEFDISYNSRGYNVEIKMPFADLPDFSADPGHLFGVEFQLNDNDNDERQNFLKWKSALDNSYFDPSIFGTAILFDSIAE